MKKILILAVFIISTFTSCEKAIRDCDNFPQTPPEGLFHWDVARVEGPTSSLVNQPLIIEVTYPTSSGCDYVSDFVTSNCENNTILVKAYGNTLLDSPCTMAAVPKKINFEFIPNVKGQFVFEFINRDNSVISFSVTIN
jgi:hypothetical protein